MLFSPVTIICQVVILYHRKSVFQFISRKNDFKTWSVSSIDVMFTKLKRYVD